MSIYSSEESHNTSAKHSGLSLNGTYTYSWKSRFNKYVINSSFMRILTISFLFFMLFFSFNTTQNLQTTLHDQWGFWSLSILYFFFSFSNFISSAVVRTIGERLSFFFGGMTYTLYISSNLYPVPWLILPAAAINGIGAAILWNSQGSYLTKTSSEGTIGFNSGVFFSIFMSNHIFGNLFSALFLTKFANDDEYENDANFTETQLLFSILALISIIAVLGFLFFIRSPTSERTGRAATNILDTIKLFREQTILLLAPIIIYSGLSQSLVYGSFTYLIGDIQTIGFIMAICGAADCAGSLINGILSSKFGKRVVILAASISALIAFITSIVITQIKYPGEYFYLYYVVAAIAFGYADSGFNTQIYSMLGSFYTDRPEPAFAAFKLLQALSTSMSFLYSNYIPYPFIVLICAFFLLMGVVLLVILDSFVNPIDPNITKKTYMTDSDYAVSDTDIGD